MGMLQSSNNKVHVDSVKVLCPTRHRIGHFGDVPQGNLLAWYGKTKPNNKGIHSPIKTNVLQHKINTKKTKVRFSHLLRHPAWKRRGSIK